MHDREAQMGPRRTKGGRRFAWLAGLGWCFACAPSPKTVANVTTGITGCPQESLVVFNYVKASRTWSASCGDALYVCSDGRGPARCTPQQGDTVDRERAVRAKALAQLSPSQRAWFVDRDISLGDWPTFGQLVATIKAMSATQLNSVDPSTVYSAGSAELAQAVQACEPRSGVTFRVDNAGKVTLPYPKACAVDVVNRPELGPLRARPNTRVVLLPGLFGVTPIARPAFGKAPAAPAAEPAAPRVATLPSSAPPVSPELDAAVRQWLDKSAAAVVACTGKDPSALLVDVAAEGSVAVSIRGGTAGAPEEGCVRSALGAAPALPAGPARILHVVKGEP